MDDLIERLRAVKWEVTDDGDRMPDDPTQKCVFVDMRPDEFEALLREAAAALEAAREDASLVYRMIPTLPVTPETCEQATDALTQFCLSFHAAIDQARGKGVA